MQRSLDYTCWAQPVQGPATCAHLQPLLDRFLSDCLSVCLSVCPRLPRTPQAAPRIGPIGPALFSPPKTAVPAPAPNPLLGSSLLRLRHLSPFPRPRRTGKTVCRNMGAPDGGSNGGDGCRGKLAADVWQGRASNDITGGAARNGRT